MDSEPIPRNPNQKENQDNEPQIYIPAKIDLSNAPGVPEEKWRDENGQWREGLIFISASGRYNGRLLNYTPKQIKEIKDKYQRLCPSDKPKTENQVPSELFPRIMEDLRSQIIRSGNFDWCAEDFVIIDRNTQEGEKFLNYISQAKKTQNEEAQKNNETKKDDKNG